MFTVKELIQFLEKLPEDYKVMYIRAYQDEYDEIQTYEEALRDCDIYRDDESKKIIIWES